MLELSNDREFLGIARKPSACQIIATMKQPHAIFLVAALALPVGAADETTNAPKSVAPKPAPARPTATAPGKAEKWIGVTAGPVNEMVRAQLASLPEGQGLMVYNISKESPAVVSGLERFDIIVRADGKPVSTPQDLQDALNRRNFGTQIRLELLHKGAQKQIYVIVLERPEGEPAVGSGGPGGPRGMFGSNMRPEDISISFAYTDANGQRQTLSASNLAEFGQKAQQDENFRNRVQQMFQNLQQNSAGITIQLRPVQKPAQTPANP
ncbi:MAG: PDZ domain-containing protein [Verrucomicrobia bacterium]|nr:PDZ domain-containing protein [Verrucomicrobiota bacterium]